MHPRTKQTPRRQSLLIGRRGLPGPKAGFTRNTSRKASFTATQFHVLLTLSSKFFSNFHHCTCFLSVLGSYLALRGVYLALWAALSSYPTLGRGQQSRTTALRAYHPLWAVATVKLDFDRRPNLGRDPSKRHIPQGLDDLQFGDGLFPFHSPLLRESQLFSFPPLINMLKFGG